VVYCRFYPSINAMTDRQIVTVVGLNSNETEITHIHRTFRINNGICLAQVLQLNPKVDGPHLRTMPESDPTTVVATKQHQQSQWEK